jgi:hypothetical protein
LSRGYLNNSCQDLRLFSERASNNRIHDTDSKYYANGEDAYEMRKYFKGMKSKGK